MLAVCGLVAAETPGADKQPYRPALPGQVVQHPIVAAVDVPGWYAADRACRLRLERRDDDGEAVGVGRICCTGSPAGIKGKRRFDKNQASMEVSPPPYVHSEPERLPAAREMRENQFTRSIDSNTGGGWVGNGPGAAHLPHKNVFP